MEAKKIIITGGATRIGSAIAKSLAGYDVDIVIHFNKSRKSALQLKMELEEIGAKVFLIKADLSNINQTKKIVPFAYKKMKGLDCLINNASLFENDNLKSFTSKSWTKHLDVNLKAPAYLTKEFAKNNGFVKTLFGRKCIIDDPGNRGPGGKAFMERAAINAPIQGTAADIIKRAMIKIPKNLKKENLKTKMIMQVHDELVFETKDSEIEKTMSIVIKEMSEAHKPVVDLSVDLKVEAASGKNWDQAH